MASKILNKIFKIFFAFLCIVVLVGFLFLSVRNYVMPEVSVTKPLENSMLVKKYYFTGKVKPRKIIEVKADKKMYISEINVKNGQIVEPGISLIKFDMSKQNITVNTKVYDIRNNIKKSEIEKLNYDKQLENVKLSVERAKDLYNKAEEEYKKASVLYENGAITEKELKDKKYSLDSCKADYENSLSSLRSENEMHDMNIVRLNDDIKSLQSELQYELKGNADEDYQLTVNQDGVYSLSDKVYVDYITDKNIINEGDTVIKYAVYNSNKDMCIEAVVDRKTSEKVFGENCLLYFWKSDEKKRNSITTESIREFSDHSEIIFPLNEELNEKVNVQDNLSVLAQAEEKFTTVVDKTAIVPIGDLKADNYCYMYLVEEEDSIMGKTQYLNQNKYKILAVGESTVAVEPDTQSKNIDRYTVIVNFASSLLEDKMRVRVIK